MENEAPEGYGYYYPPGATEPQLRPVEVPAEEPVNPPAEEEAPE